MMPNSHANIEDSIRDFSKTQSPADLQRAVGELCQASFPQTNTSEIPSADSSLAKKWLKLFSVVDDVISQRELSLHRPFVKVSPPAGKDGKPSNYLPGVDPESVTDPDVKQRYKTAISENNKRLLAANELSQLATIERQATGYFFAWAGARYSSNQEARELLLREASALKLSTERMRKIHEAVDKQN